MGRNGFRGSIASEAKIRQFFEREILRTIGASTASTIPARSELDHFLNSNSLVFKQEILCTIGTSTTSAIPALLFPRRKSCALLAPRPRLVGQVRLIQRMRSRSVPRSVPRSVSCSVPRSVPRSVPCSGFPAPFLAQFLARFLALFLSRFLARFPAQINFKRSKTRANDEYK